MATNVYKSTEFVYRTPVYVLKLQGPLINGQKAEVTINEIRLIL